MYELVWFCEKGVARWVKDTMCSFPLDSVSDNSRNSFTETGHFLDYVASSPWSGLSVD
jgi:hypothetical protein